MTSKTAWHLNKEESEKFVKELLSPSKASKELEERWKHIKELLRAQVVKD